jgi:hypothetical protein
MLRRCRSPALANWAAHRFCSAGAVASAAMIAPAVPEVVITNVNAATHGSHCKAAKLHLPQGDGRFPCGNRHPRR